MRKNGTANPSSLSFLAKVLSNRQVRTMTAVLLRDKYIKLQEQMDSDEVKNLPPRAQYVVKKINAAFRYNVEHYRNALNGT